MKLELEKQLPFVIKAASLLQIPDDQIQISDEGDCINAGMWALFPEAATRKVPDGSGSKSMFASVDQPYFKWSLVRFEQGPSRHDESPNEFDETGHGTFDSLMGLMLTIVQYNAYCTLNGLAEALYHEQMRETDDIYDELELERRENLREDRIGK
jgi:hypothetical protein